MLSLYSYIFFGIMSSWLVWFGFMFYYISILDTTFKFVPLERYERYKYLFFICVFLLLSYYIFIVRFSRIGKSINAFDLYVQLYEIVYSFNLVEKVVLGLVIFLVVIFWYLVMRTLYQYLRKCFLALILYYYQFNIMDNIFHKIADIPYNYTVYLWNRVEIFYNTQEAFAIVMLIWPFSINIIERNIFRFILPYLIYFDYVVNEYCITKIFMVMPWYYLYTIIRSTIILFNSVLTAEHMAISRKIYGGRKKWNNK